MSGGFVRRARAAAVLALAAVASLAVAPPLVGGAGAADQAAIISGVGWWTSSPAASAPAGGIAVQAGPNGSTVSQAAVEVTTSTSSIDKAVLVLTEEGGVQAASAALQVCPTPNAWEPAEKGDAADAPKPECDRGKAPLTRDGATATWSADVRSLLLDAEEGDEVSLMIVPAGAGAVPVGFEVRFQKPVLDATGGASTSSPSFSSTEGSSSSSAPSSSDTASSSSSSSSSFEGASGSFSSFSSSASAPSGPLPSFAAPSSFVADTGVEVAAAPADEAAVAEAIAPTPASPFRAIAPTSSTSGGNRGAQALFFLAVASVVGIAVGVGHARFRGEPAL
jgi:hypothetical protein